MWDLERFVSAQAGTYEHALAEIKDGRKRSHWMWFIFPQFAGLGRSGITERYAIRSLDEARAYVAHSVLGPRLVEITTAVNKSDAPTAMHIFGPLDAIKLRSSMTLFAFVAPEEQSFKRVLAKYFEGAPDPATEKLLTEATISERGSTSEVHGS